MFRSRAMAGVLTLVAVTTAASAAVAGAAPPDDTSPAPPPDIDFQIDMLLGLVPDDELDEYLRSQDRRFVEAMQACMNEAGFEYVGVDEDLIGFDPYRGMDRIEYAQQYGYGYWTALDPDVSQAQAIEIGVELADLSPSEQDAWFAVQQECYDAIDQDGVDPSRNPMVQQALADFEAHVDADPRVRDAREQWRACVSAAGHDFAAPDEMQSSIVDYHRDAETIERLALSEAWKPSSPDHPEWQDLVDLEISVAVADATCTPPLDEVRLEVKAELRPQLVEVWQTIDWGLAPVDEQDPLPPDAVIDDA